MSSRNIIFGYQVAFDEEQSHTLIDSNERANELIREEEKAYKAKLMEEEYLRRLAALEESGGEIPEGMDPAEFLGLADTIMGEEPEAAEEVVPQVDYIAEAQEEARRILDEAEARAQEIMSEAQINAEALKNVAKIDGERDGYNIGTQRATEELAEVRRKLEAEVAAIEQDFYEKQNDLEHIVVDACLDVFEKVFSAELSGRKDVIFHLLDHCLMNIERSRQLQIKVNDVNSEYIKSRINEIQSKIGSDVTLDVISDPILNESQCIIETDGGLFDCSIDTELESLIRSIKALS